MGDAADDAQVDPPSPLDLSEVHELAVRNLERLQQRYTANRKAVVTVLADAPAPCTIAEVLDAEPRLSQSSTYRNLAVLEEAGVVHRIVTSADHARFELAEEMTGAHHHHLVCTGCGVVIDVVLPPDLEHELHRALAAVAEQEHFDGAHHRVDLVGRCTDCRNRAGQVG